MTQRQVNDDLQKLSKAYPPPATEKKQRQLKRISQMSSFYKTRAVDHEHEYHGAMKFIRFVDALAYASAIIRMYHKLTIKLAKLAQEEKNNG